MLSRVLRHAGLRCAAIDIKYWDEYAEGRPGCRDVRSNPLDMLSPSGMALLYSKQLRLIEYI